ncbi:hypothetical protein K502DRAFT_158180 [Neoconidiobolus thromboides FSU 785]|nr:hypothetical protein K502DRAFT_158180 [Neoconidiobolus thromboides FSU 785]
MILVLGFNYYTDIKLIGCQNEDSKFYSLELDENNCINLPMMKGEELKLVQLQIDFNNHYKIPNLSNDLDDTNGMPIVLVLNSSGRLQSYDMLSSEFCSNPELKSKLMQHYNDKRNQLLFDYEKFEKKIISIESMNTHSDDDDNESEEEEQEVIEEKVKEVGEETIEEAIKEVSDEDHEEEEIGSEIQRMKIDDYFKKEIKKGIKAVQPNLVKKEEGAFVLEEEVKDDINDIEDYLKSKGLDLFNGKLIFYYLLFT